MSKKSPIARPLRDPDHVSKRGVPYWWAPEWIRATGSAQTSYGKIAAIKEKNGEVNLYMKSKDGGHSFIQGSIQREFKQWHEDRSIDYILLGMDIDEIIVDETE
jgi:hypothetical protein